MEFENINSTSQNVLPSNVNHVYILVFENKENQFNLYRTITKFLKKMSTIANLERIET
jgi:hypothetical protein